MTKAARFKQNQKFRIIVGQVCFYATSKQIRDGVGDLIQCNQAIREALRALEYIRSGTGVGDQSTCGLAGTWEGLNVQINIA